MQLMVYVTIGLCFTSLQVGPAAGEQKSLVQVNNELAVTFYKYIADNHGRWNNIFFSPLSIAQALGMMRAGAKGETWDQIDGLVDLGATSATFRSLLETAGEQHVNYTLRSANRLYSREGLQLLDTYTANIQNNFLSQPKTLDFGKDPEQAREEINTWVANYTEDKITDMFPFGSIRPETSLVLVNAIYFRGLWQFPFDRSRTAERPFQLTEQASYNMEMMWYKSKKKLRIARKEEAGYRVVEVPYLENQVNMYLIVPDKVEGLADIEKKLDATMLSDITSGMNLFRWRVDLILPKFKISSNLNLKSALMGQGVTDMFDESTADFSGITGRPNIYVSDALHKAYLEINEEGTEAAASTGISFVPTSIAPETQVKVDRPFLMILKERSTGAVLFIGRLVVPLGAEEVVETLQDGDTSAGGRSQEDVTCWILLCTLVMIGLH